MSRFKKAPADDGARNTVNGLRGVIATVRSTSRRTLICSMTPDRKIGSLYFEDGVRIRTTHRNGPERNQHRGPIMRFNIDDGAAHREFRSMLRSLFLEMGSSPDFDRWLARRLTTAGAEDCPAWATRVHGPDSAFDAGDATPPPGTVMFEIFTTARGEVSGWHVSRGIAAKFETDRRTVSVLEAALDQLSKNGVTEPAARNEVFYEFVASRLPEFAANIRKPEEVR